MPVHSLFQSTLSMRRATADIHRFFDKLDISIHALHEESDHAPFEQRGLAGISIHALHEESDAYAPFLTETDQFQSTLSMRRATAGQYGNGGILQFQSTLSMRRATFKALGLLPRDCISIHALHEESDFKPAHALGSV